MNFRAYFAIPNDLIYLNSGTMSYSPLRVIAAAAHYKKQLEDNPAHGFMQAWGGLWSAQQALAQFIKARPQDMFLRANVTYAINDFLMALQLPVGSEILISDHEYGAITNICRHKAKLEGLTVRTFLLESLTAAEEFAEQLSAQTKLVVLSHVSSSSGWVLPVEKFAHICRARGVFLAIDGAHGAGSQNLDFSSTQIDFYGSNLHKWMLGPKGTGFGWVAPHLRQHLLPRFAGWTTFETFPPFSDFAAGDEWTTRWMLCSTLNFSDFFALEETIHFWNQHDPAAIFRRQRELRNLVAQKISTRTGWREIQAPAYCADGPMVSFVLPPKLSALGVALLYKLKNEHSLQINMMKVNGHWCLRLAPHIYNTEDETVRAAEILHKLS